MDTTSSQSLAFASLPDVLQPDDRLVSSPSSKSFNGAKSTDPSPTSKSMKNTRDSAASPYSSRPELIGLDDMPGENA